MSKFKSYLPLLLALPFIFTLLVINLNLPTPAQAKPLAGFTPTPTSRHDDGGDDKDDSPPSTDNAPTDYVLVEMDRCDLQCSAGMAYGGEQSDFQPLASVGVSDGASFLFTPATKPQALPELLLPVQLVHNGSGFIVEGELSDAKPTRFSVPYQGEWQVWITDSPRFMTAEAVDVTGSNLPDLQSQLANGPVSLGLVQANTSGPQMVKCPLACVIQSATQAQTEPIFLPQTGADHTQTKWSYLIWLICGGLLLLINKILAQWFSRKWAWVCQKIKIES